MAIAKVEPLTTARALRGPFDYRLPAEMDDVGVGSVLRVPFGRQRLLGVVVELAEKSEVPPEKLAEPLEALEAGVPAELVRLGLWVAREYCSTPSRGLQLVLPPGTMGRLKSNGEFRQRRPNVDRTVGEPAPARFRRRRRRAGDGSPAGRPDLNAEQLVAIESITAALDGAPGAKREVLLHGVTGSGKTEVYLAAVEATLQQGRGAIVLVPEIGLTPQAVRRFQERFGDRVALLHSAMAEGARYEQWRRLRDGEARVAVGPRSAIFAPVRDLGLVVIDEEHDSSYKQESDPRYDARDVARHRAAEAGAVLVAGTATPRPETWLELPHVELPRRVDGQELPGVDVVDMRGHGAGPIHPATADALIALREQGGKAIVLLNRRGFSPHLSCRSCGHHWGCPNCDVSLVMHRGSERLRCHHCGHAEEVPSSCPDCGSATVARHGAGTERVEALLSQLLDPVPVFRLDADSAARRGAHRRILGEFEAAKSGVLVGTQMVAKGHDFPDVVLSVVLDADATLRFPDFRAEERTFALVAQLAGRSGRSESGGRVIVQTLAPDASSIAAAARHDAPGFLAAELQRREALHYPPFSELVRIGLAAPEEQDVERAAEVLQTLLDPPPPGAQVLGPAPQFRVGGRHRRQFLVKAPERTAAVAAVRQAVEEAASSKSLRSVALSVDVDPQ
jgi:primosomal protein N' (replication factor Y) (superfamily II helicase)